MSYGFLCQIKIKLIIIIIIIKVALKLGFEEVMKHGEFRTLNISNSFFNTMETDVTLILK